MKRVVLLAGHNFKNQGCEVILDGTRITEFNLTTWLVAEIFKKERLTKIDLIAKARNEYKNLVSEVNSLNADYLISCHFNAANGKVQGTEVLYAHRSSKGRKLASVAQNIIVKNLELNDRGVKPITLNDRGGSILNKTKPVAILLEPFFLDSVENFDELLKLMDKTVDSIIEILKSIDENNID